MTVRKLDEKIKFTRKNKSKLKYFAELSTPAQKVDYLIKIPEFNSQFSYLYSEYKKYLVSTIDKEKLLIKMTIESEQLQKLVDEGSNEKSVKTRLKRVSKIARKLKRKIKYRVREKNYFDNYLVNEWIACYNASAESCFVDLIAEQVDLIIIRQINRKRFHQFSTAMDDLVQDLRYACLTSLPKFDPRKGKPGRESFNWFSHICLKAGHMTTLRKSSRDKQETPDTDVVIETLGIIPHKNNVEDFVLSGEESDPLSAFYNYFHSYFEGRERMQLLLQILVFYILNVSFFDFKKTDFVKYGKSYGFTPAYINKFLNLVRAHKKDYNNGTLPEGL